MDCLRLRYFDCPLNMLIRALSASSETYGSRLEPPMRKLSVMTGITELGRGMAQQRFRRL
jgi:hypothetical protein